MRLCVCQNPLCLCTGLLRHLYSPAHFFILFYFILFYFILFYLGVILIFYRSREKRALCAEMLMFEIVQTWKCRIVWICLFPIGCSKCQLQFSAVVSMQPSWVGATHAGISCWQSNWLSPLCHLMSLFCSMNLSILSCISDYEFSTYSALKEEQGCLSSLNN